MHLEFSGREALIGLEPETEGCLLARADNPVLLLQGAMNMIGHMQGSSACLLICATVPTPMHAEGPVQSVEAANADHMQPVLLHVMVGPRPHIWMHRHCQRQAGRLPCKPGLQLCLAARLPGSADSIPCSKRQEQSSVSHLSSEVLEVLAEGLCIVQGPSQHCDVDGR